MTLRPAIGLVIEQQQVALSVVATTPTGRHEVASDVREFGDDGPDQVIAEMLEPWMPRPSRRARQKPWIQIGLPESRVFQAAVPVTPNNRLSSAQNYFLEAVQSTNLRAEDRIIELTKLEIGKQQLALIAACPCVLVADQLEVLERLGVRIAVMEPAPMGLARAGAHWARVPRTSKLCLRFFLGKKQALAMAISQGHPLFWHGFDLTPGEETRAVMAAYSTLWMLGRHCKVGVPIDTIVVHGRRDLALDLEPESFRERTGARLIRAPEPQYDLRAMAFGIALNNPLTEPTSVDLGRSVRSPISIRDIFPWGELLVQGLMVGGVSLFLVGATLDIETRFRSVQAQSRSFPWMGEKPQAKLEEEKKSLEKRISVIDAFRKSRMDWSGLLRTIARDTPESTVVTSLVGDAPMELESKSPRGKATSQMVIGFSTPLARDGSMPREINELISKLRAESVILKHFPSIEVTGLRGSSGSDRSATYSVVCLPTSETGKKAGARK